MDVDNEIDLLAAIQKWLPLSSLTILIYAILKLVVYYSLFNINILEHVELSEVIPLILGDFLGGFFFFSLGYFLGFLAPNPVTQELASKNLTLAEVTPKIGLRIKYYFKAAPILYALAIIIPFNLFITIFLKHLDYVALWSVWYLSLVPILTYVIPFEVFNRLKTKRNILLTRTTKVYLFLTFYLLTIGVSWAVRDYLNIKYHHTTNGFYIVVSDKKIVSTDTFYYVGHTKRSIFYYDQNTGKVTIYATSTISSMMVN